MEWWMWKVGCGKVEGGMWNGACGTGMFSHRSQMSTEAMRTACQNTDRAGGAADGSFEFVFVVTGGIGTMIAQ